MTENKKDAVDNYHKCGVNEGFCATLEMYTQPQGHVKGFSFFNVLDLSTRDIRCLGVAYKRDTKDRGVMLNYCPFCGEDLSPFRKERTEKQEEAAIGETK